MQTICGLDNSMSSPAAVFFYCDDDLNVVGYDYLNFTDTKKYRVPGHVYPLPEWNNELERIIKKNDFLVQEIIRRGVKYYAIEDYSMNSRGLVYGIAENTGYLKIELYKAELKCRKYSPTSNKMFFAGKGTSNKKAMVETYLTEFPENPLGIPEQTLRANFSASSNSYASGIDDIVDAFALCMCLLTELRLRAGKIQIDDLVESKKKVFQIDKKGKKVSPLQMDFI